MRISVAFCGLVLLAAWPGAVMAAAEVGGADAPPPAAATGTDRAAQLDTLFAKLKVAPNVEEGRAIERDIVHLWLESGDAEVDRLMGYAIAAMNVDSYTLALNYLDTIVVTKPDYAEGWNKRATVYYLMDRFDESIADIERTLALEPRHFGALAGLGMIMVKLGDKERAIEAFKAALDIDPNLEEVRVELRVLEDQLRKGI
jgi:tetratricopeptide (TPR) repeat protein